MFILLSWVLVVQNNGINKISIQLGWLSAEQKSFSPMQYYHLRVSMGMEAGCSLTLFVGGLLRQVLWILRVVLLVLRLWK